MITVQNLSKYYNVNRVLHIPDLTIEKGGCLGLVGNNGAGKTTFFNLLLDLIPATTGTIFSKGEEVHMSEHWKNYTAAFIDESFLIGYLTPEEYFYFIGELRGCNRADVDVLLARYTEFFNNEVLDKGKYLRDLSKGNQKKVGIIAALIGDPELIILDEPFANLDPSTQIRLKKIIKDLAVEKDVTVLISSHDLQHTVEICERIVVLNKGEVEKDLQTSEETLKELKSFFT